MSEPPGLLKAFPKAPTADGPITAKKHDRWWSDTENEVFVEEHRKVKEDTKYTWEKAAESMNSEMEKREREGGERKRRFYSAKLLASHAHNLKNQNHVRYPSLLTSDKNNERYETDNGPIAKEEDPKALDGIGPGSQQAGSAISSVGASLSPSMAPFDHSTGLSDTIEYNSLASELLQYLSKGDDSGMLAEYL